MTTLAEPVSAVPSASSVASAEGAGPGGVERGQAGRKRKVGPASNPGFTHLHLHSQYSLLDGAIRMDELCPTVKEQGMDAVAVTDHGNMYGAVHFYQQAKKHGVKPIFGVEAYVAGDKGRADRTDRKSSHLVLLAKDAEGYKNLTALVSQSFMEGFYYKPRIDKELLKKHSKGLFGLSACLGGVVNKKLLTEGEAAAAQAAKDYSELFEPGHFYLELQDNGLREQVRANQALLNISEIYDIPTAVTADAHYRKPEDAAAHEILMCIGQGMSREEFRAKDYQHSDKLYVRNADDMWKDFERLAPEAMENTQRIAQACNVELDLESRYLPNFGVPDGFTRETYLEKLATDGLKARMAEARYPIDASTYKSRLDYELSVITKMGFAGYFLIVWDFIAFAKNNTIPVGPGRGSGAGSIVAWALRITDLDPIPYDLLFERFLNPERVSMPDFDIDFCMDRRGEVIDYVSKKYGETHVAQIVTYSQLSAKSGLKDVGRVMGLPFAEVNDLTKLIPGLVNGKKVSIDQALEIEPRLKEIQNEKPIYKEVIDVGRALEGLNRQTGIHAAGVVIGDKPIWEYVPVCRGKDGEIVTQFAKDEVELAGLVKFDFLGLKTLTVLAYAQNHIRKRAGDGPLGSNLEFNVDKVPLDDPKVYELIASGDTDGVFQLESSGFKELLKRLKPDCFEDVVAAVALYRPGPLDAGMVDDYIDRKHGKKQIEFPHPVCEPILRTTYGVIVYQEQVMRIAVDLCGFTMGEADVLRKAMGKKKADVMAKMRKMFVDGALNKSGMKAEDGDHLFTQIEKFAGYAFNKSHSAAYAVISVQTAFLKRYYPVEFMAALLSTEMGTQDSVVKYIQSAREHGIKILPPDVQRSERDFSVVDTVVDGHPRRCILFGLGAVKGVGDSAIDAILGAREKRAGDAAAKGEGPATALTSIFAFCEQVDLKKFNRKVLEALIKSGAFDGFSKPRSVLMAVAERALDAGTRTQKDREVGQTNLFAAFAAAKPAAHGAAAVSASAESYPNLEEWSEKERLRQEKEALGFYITGHPLDRYAADLSRLVTTDTANLARYAGADHRFTEITIAGVISAYRERPLKNGSGRMAFITVEDLHGSIECLVFSKVYAECGEILRSDDPVLVRGAVIVDGDDGGEAGAGAAVLKLRVSEVTPLSDARAKKAKRVEIEVPHHEVDDARLIRLRDLLSKHRGDVPMRVTLVKQHQFEAVIHLPDHARVSPTDELLTGVDRIFGRKVVRLA